jgi:hypothetical protein
MSGGGTDVAVGGSIAVSPHSPMDEPQVASLGQNHMPVHCREAIVSSLMLNDLELESTHKGPRRSAATGALNIPTRRAESELAAFDRRSRCVGQEG